VSKAYNLSHSITSGMFRKADAEMIIAEQQQGWSCGTAQF
jgi:hypothetical protein